MATTSTKSPRRTQEQRRTETRTAILDAAVQVLVEDGYAGFSAIGVAARAGVSRGAQENYFPRKIDLVAAATRHAQEQAIVRARKAARSIGAPETAVGAFLAASEEFFFDSAFLAQMEVVIGARADRPLADIVYPVLQQARAELDRIWLDALTGAGYRRDNARQFIELTQYLLRGIFLADTWLPYRVRRAAMLTAWRQIAPHVLGDNTQG